MTTDLAVLLGILAFALLTMPVYAMSAARRAPDPHAPAEKGSFVLGSFVRDWFLWFVGPAERGSLALGLGPLFYNLTGLFFGVLSGVFFAVGRFDLAGWSILLGGVADILDGRIARATGVASPRGAFLDSTIDRFAEVGAFVGLAVWFGGDRLALFLVVTALGGSLLVSYARARGESQGVLCKLGFLQRAERMLLLGFGGLLDPAATAWAGRAEPGTVMVPVLGLVAAGTLATAVFRTVWIAQRLPEVRPPRSDPSNPPSGGRP